MGLRLCATDQSDAIQRVVVRGYDFKADLDTLRPYIREIHPVLVGVDGGADAITEAGFAPDIIVGDMDSVSDEVLRSGAQLIVHAYPDGRAPGMDRLNALGLVGTLWRLNIVSSGSSVSMCAVGGSMPGKKLLRFFPQQWRRQR